MKVRILQIAAIYLIIVPILCQGQPQNFLFKKDGERFQFLRHKFSKDTIEIKKVDKKWTKLHVDEVEGFYSIEDEIFYALISKSIRKESPFELDPPGDYFFTPRVIEGPLNLYMETNTYTTGSGAFVNGVPARSVPGATVTNDVYYVGREKEYEMFPTGLKILVDRTSKIKTLSGMIQDNPKLSEYVASGDFKFTIQSITDLVNEYNLSKWQPDSTLTSKKGSISFYSQLRGFSGGTTIKGKLIVENKEYELKPRSLVSISLPTDQFSKICFVSDTDKRCQLVKANPYNSLYYMIKSDNDNAEIRMEQVSYTKAVEYLKNR